MKVSSIWFDAPHVRWGRVVATAAIVFMPLLGWMAYERGLFDAGVGDAGLGDEPAGPLARDAAAASPLVRTVARMPARVVATARASSSASAPASAVRLADESDTCRAGSTKAERDLPRAWLAAAAASPDVQVQAAAALMAGVEAPQRDTRDMRDMRDRLARLAIESRDPVVYAFAMQRCRADAVPASGRFEAGACQLLSHEQWASVDADNAVPWLALADAVVARGGDPSDAMFRAAQTRSVRSHRAALLGALLSVQPAGTKPMERLRVSDEAFRLQSSWPMPGAALPVFCSASALGDSNRRLACESLAQLLAGHGDTLGDLMAARSLGERLGWSADRLAALKTERDALAALYPAAAEIGEPTGCAAAEARLRFGTQAAKAGELGTLRDWQRRSGRSTVATAQ